MSLKQTYESLIDTCDEIMSHIGKIRRIDPTIPGKDFMPALDRLLDTRSRLTKERDSILPPPTTTNNNKTTKP